MKPAGRRRLLAAALPVAGLGLIVLLVAYLEGDLPEEFGDLGGFFRGLLAHYGAAASLALLYVEESGIPLPVPGDVYVAYLGKLAAGSPLLIAAAWLGVVLVVVAGSSNLYLVSRRWGHRLLEHRLAAAFHLDPAKLASAERWFDRWGPVAIVFGRHIPGFRVPITVVSGVFRVPYAYFAGAVALSTAVWAGIWIWLGVRYGVRAVDLLTRHRWVYLVGVGVVAVIAAYLLIRLWRLAQAPPAPAARPESPGRSRPRSEGSRRR